MAILHGTWLPEGQFFLWGETWRRCGATPLNSTTLEVPCYPLVMDQAELLQWLAIDPATQGIKWPKTLPQLGGSPAQPESSLWVPQVVALPATMTEDGLLPEQARGVGQPNGDRVELRSLYPWQVWGYRVEASALVPLLNSLPLGMTDRSYDWLGGDLRFWAHIARWSLDLMARSKFLPALQVHDDELVARWRPLLDSAVDQARLRAFAQQMPTACRLYSDLEGLQVERAGLTLSLPLPEQLLITQFLQTVVDVQVRAIAQEQRLVPASASRKPKSTDAALESWLVALGSRSTQLPRQDSLIRLADALETWTAPLVSQLQTQQTFRTCLTLRPPLPSQENWRLVYGLQAVADPDIQIEAGAIWSRPVEQLRWQGHWVIHPQETLLAGLGLASRLCSAIEPSLQQSQPLGCELTPIQAYEFIKSTAWRLQDSGIGVLLPPGLAQIGDHHRLGLRIEAQAPSPDQKRLGLQSLLDFRWELTLGGQPLSKADLDQLLARQSPLVEINGEWVELRPQDVRAAQNFFASRQDRLSLSLEDALRLSSGETQMLEKLPVVSFEASGAIADLLGTLTTGNKQVAAIDPPATFQGTLRPYQARGVGWLAFLEQWGLGACLADDMGLGKTIQTIAFLLHLQDRNALERPVLLVCPTSVLGNWEREVKKFGPTLKVMIHHGDKRPKGKAFGRAVAGKQLVITSYALVHRDLKELQSLFWQIVILDEAQNIKNADSKQSQSVRQLPAEFRVALTGTPIENRLTELWSIFDFLNPGYLGPRPFFQRRFATPIEKYGDTASLKTLKSLVQPFILRRLKTDRSIIQDLPQKQEMTVFCGLSAEQASLYQALVEKVMTEVEVAEGIQRHGLILSLLVKLKQICNHPAHFLKQEQLDDQPRSGKLLRLQEMLEELLSEGDRALIFTQFTEWGKLLQQYLQRILSQEVLFLHGGVARDRREAIVDRFQHDPQGPRIFILSLKAGGVGLNLTRANHVFHFDRWWNPAVENQATDRAFRIGQTQQVQVHKFVCTGTLEEKIHHLIEQKKALAEQVVSAGENWLTNLDTSQLRDLLLLDRSAIIDDGAEPK